MHQSENIKNQINHNDKQRRVLMANSTRHAEKFPYELLGDRIHFVDFLAFCTKEITFVTSYLLHAQLLHTEKGVFSKR